MQIKKSPRDAQYADDTRFEGTAYGLDSAENTLETRTEPFASRSSRPGMQSTQRPEGTDRTEPATRSESVIDRHSSFDGRFETEHDMRVEGTISGEVICRGLFTVDREATVRARVQAHDAHLQGHFEGDMVCEGKLLLSATAHVTGTMKAALLVVEEGATVSGTVDTTGQGATSARPAVVKNAGATSDETPREPATVTRSPRRDLPSFAIVASDERATSDRN